MTCFWKGILSSLTVDELKTVLNITNKNPQMFVKSLKQHAKYTKNVLWQGQSLSEKELEKWTGTYRYPDKSLRVVELIDGWLYWSRPGRMKFRLLPSAANRFLLENTFTQVEFFPDGEDVRVEIKARIVRRTAHKVKTGQ